MIISKIPKYPWQNIGSDLFEVKGHTYFVLVDYFSRYLEVAKLSSTTSSSIVAAFREELGTMQNIKAELMVMKGAKPRFHSPRTMPFAHKEAVERELKRLENLGIICKVTHSTWSAPIVPIVKAMAQ